jgi:ZIP family zinc transporter
MVDFIMDFHPIVQALFATLFTWFVTALGAGAVFLRREISRKVLDGMLGFAAGVMIAASYWSLLAPAIEMSGDMSVPEWFPALVGFLGGGAFLWGIDKILPHIHRRAGEEDEEQEGVKTAWQRVTLLILAITLHNFPEGLAVGVAFGAAANRTGTEAEVLVAGAIALAIGIGIQNFPEGMAVSMPLRREGATPVKSFWYGQLSAVVEPIAGVLGAGAVIIMEPLLPYALAFAAGAMIFVVAEDLIPEAQCERNTDIATIGVMLGFAVMMFLDVSLG